MCHAEYSSNRALPMLEHKVILLCASGFGNAQTPHLSYMVDLFNNFVSPSELISVDSITASPSTREYYLRNWRTTSSQS